MQPVGGEGAGEIHDIASRLGAGSKAVEGTAWEIYLRAKGRQGFSHRELRAAAVYASCRLFGIPRTLKDVSAASGVRAAFVARSYRRILLDENLKVPVQNPASFVAGIAGRAGLEPAVERRAVEILSTLKDTRAVVGKAPTVVAAASLYAAYLESHPAGPNPGSDGQPNQESIAKAAGVSEVSVRSQLRRVRFLLDRCK